MRKDVKVNARMEGFSCRVSKKKTETQYVLVIQIPFSGEAIRDVIAKRIKKKSSIRVKCLEE